MVKKHVKTTKEKKGWNCIKRKFYSYFKSKVIRNKKLKIKRKRLKNNDTKIKRTLFKKKFNHHLKSQFGI